jgi:hypothetical protein
MSENSELVYPLCQSTKFEKQEGDGQQMGHHRSKNYSDDMQKLPIHSKFFKRKKNLRFRLKTKDRRSHILI